MQDDSVPGDEFNETKLDKDSFLQKALAYGHLNVLDSDQLQFVSHAEFCASLRPEVPAEQWLQELISESTDDEVKIAITPPEPSLDHCYGRLFYSSPIAFQNFLGGGEIPILTMERQFRTFLITDLPESLLELLPRRFCHFWVISL